MGLKGIIVLISKNIVDRFIEDLLRGIYAYGYESPSAVQSRAIQQICKGRGILNLNSVLIGRCHRTG
jgi:superfamily II DNA/RNA helicase